MKPRMGRNLSKILLALLVGHHQGHTPTYRDMMALTGIKSLNGISSHLEHLRKAGLITWEAGLARTVRPLCRFIPADQLEAS